MREIGSVAIKSLIWLQHFEQNYPNPKADLVNALTAFFG